jgi:hypothetical protein
LAKVTFTIEDAKEWLSNPCTCNFIKHLQEEKVKLFDAILYQSDHGSRDEYIGAAKAVSRVLDTLESYAKEGVQ